MLFGKEGFMRKRYDRTLQEGYAAMERTNFLRCTVFSGYFDYRCAGDGHCHAAVGFVRPGSQNDFSACQSVRRLR